MTVDEGFRLVLDRVRRELSQPLVPAARAAADDLRSRHAGIEAVLFYGSCLRDGAEGDKILDFYLLATDLAAANGGALLGLLNRLLPPNVYYRETPFDGRVARSKYALMSTHAFARAMARDSLNVGFWGRFAQPCALAWARDAATGERVARAVAQAVVTAAAAAAPMLARPFTADALWSEAFTLTYGAELRSENAETRGAEIFANDVGRYRALAVPALRAAGIDADEREGLVDASIGAEQTRAERRRWRYRRALGKTLSVLRLVKGAFTFDGGLDYLAWKIRRHSGVEIEVKPWHRRHQLIGGLVLLLRTRGSGAYR
jgi:hypothetical protein